MTTTLKTKAGSKLTSNLVEEQYLKARNAAGPATATFCPSGYDLHGVAFDLLAHPTHGELMPLTPRQQADYPSLVGDIHAVNDLQSGVDSKAADAFKQKIAAMSSTDRHAYLDEIDIIYGYAHGTHVAGIAAQGNPAIRLA